MRPLTFLVAVCLDPLTWPVESKIWHVGIVSLEPICSTHAKNQKETHGSLRVSDLSNSKSEDFILFFCCERKGCCRITGLFLVSLMSGPNTHCFQTPAREVADKDLLPQQLWVVNRSPSLHLPRELGGEEEGDWGCGQERQWREGEGQAWAGQSGCGQQHGECSLPYWICASAIHSCGLVVL